MLTYDEVADIIRSIEMNTPFSMEPDWPTRRMAYPGSIVPVITQDDGNLDVEDLKWGFNTDWKKGPVFNTRIETVLSPNPGLWKNPIESGRCVVATAGFFESHAIETLRSPRTGKTIKQQYLFEAPEAHPTFLAGVKSEGTFSIVTTEPNRFVSPVHARMPLVLEASEIPVWLYGDFASLQDRSTVKLISQPEKGLIGTAAAAQPKLL